MHGAQQQREVAVRTERESRAWWRSNRDGALYG